jgi:hypothetical protein
MRLKSSLSCIRILNRLEIFALMGAIISPELKEVNRKPLIHNDL